MFIFLTILTTILFILLLIIAAIQPVHSKFSIFELRRRSQLGDEIARRNLEREGSFNDILSLRQVFTSLLLVIVVSLCVTIFGWITGIFMALVVTLGFGAMSNLDFIKSWSKGFYGYIEEPLLDFMQKTPFIVKLLRSMPTDYEIPDKRIESREELQYLISNSEDVLTTDVRSLIVHGLSFGDVKVDSIMTPRSMIACIRKNDLLGPLMLNELHKTGHSRLPVIDEDIDHVVGILHISSLLSLDIKSSPTAERAMVPKVYYIREDQTLRHALAAFLRTRHHLFVVINQFRETVGLLSLEDVIEALIGQKIVDEFDKHDDLRAVALRNPGSNNKPEKCQNV